MKNASFKKRIRYWFDNHMAGGSFRLIRLLAVFTLLVILLIAFLVFRLGLNEGGFLGAFWESLATIINAWMPSYEDGSIGYLILMSVTAIIGLLITSVLIGIISSGIEEKITSLKKGSSEVIEAGHTVVLGFYEGEYTLIRQLVLAAASDPACIVVAGDADPEEMRSQIYENISVPKNVRIICRNLNIFDPVALEKCALTDCRSVIISPTDDVSTIKALLAVSSLIGSKETPDVRVSAVVSKAEYLFPQTIAEKHNVTTLNTSETIAKIIAHSCTEPGLSEAFQEVFNAEGSEFCSLSAADAAGLTFRELLLRMDSGIPVGILKNGQILLNPPAETVLEPDDRLLVFAEDQSSAKLAAMPELGESAASAHQDLREAGTRVSILGTNGSLGTVLAELPDYVTEVLICTDNDEAFEAASRTAKERGFSLRRFPGSPEDAETLQPLAEASEHIVILSDYDVEEEEADMKSIFCLLKLRDARSRLGLHFNITAEMRRESNQRLVITDDDTDYVVASNMSSLFLVRLSENPELVGAFRELLSNEGSELYLKTAAELSCAGTLSAAEIRKRIFDHGYLFLGYLPAETNRSIFNPGLSETITLGEEDQLIVIGED